MNTRAGKYALACLLEHQPANFKDNHFYLYTLPEVMECDVVYILQDNSQGT